jgi:hypothetical protein
MNVFEEVEILLRHYVRSTRKKHENISETISPNQEEIFWYEQLIYIIQYTSSSKLSFTPCSSPLVSHASLKRFWKTKIDLLLNFI